MKGSKQTSRKPKQDKHLDSDVCATPLGLFDVINDRWGAFDLDPCANCQNRLRENWCGLCVCGHGCESLNNDGLAIDWSPYMVFANPPYSNVMPWILKAPTAKRCVLLLKGDTSTKWFAEVWKTATEIHLLTGRICFEGDYAKGKACNFPSMLVLWDGRYPADGPSVRLWDWKPEVAAKEEKDWQEFVKFLKVSHIK